MQATTAVKILTVLLATALAVPLVPYVTGVAPPVPAVGGDYFYVDVPAGRSGELLARGLEVVETYEGFTLVRDPRGVIPGLATAGILTTPAEDLFTLRLNGYSFDIRNGEPELPASLRVSYGPSEEGVHIVHFRGPVKEEWLWALEGTGAVLQRHLGGSAVLARMTPEVAASVRQLRPVDYVGTLHPAYRIRPDLLQAGGLVEVKIITFGGESVDPVLAFLGRSGVPRTAVADGPGVMRWTETEDFGVAKARVPASLLPSVAALRGVEFIEPIYAMQVTNTDMQWIHQSDTSGVRTEWTAGLNGTGQIIAIADSGQDFDHEQFRESDSVIQVGGTTGPNSIYNNTNLARRKLIQYLPMSRITDNILWYGPGGDIHAGKDSPLGPCAYRSGHGTAVSSVAAGDDTGITIMSPGPNDGIAIGAKIFFEDIGTEAPDSRCLPGQTAIALRYIPDDYTDMFQPAYDAGARIHTNSWGSGNNDYDLEAFMVDRYMWANKDFLVLFSAGNDGAGGLGTVGSPSVNKDGLSVGWAGNANACGGGNTENDMSASSSKGTTQDGRIKPDLAAVGEGNSARSTASPGDSTATADWCWSGTSYASPAAAGGAAIVRQYLTEGWWPTGAPVPGNAIAPSAALVKSLMMAGSRKMTGANTASSACGAWTYPNCGEGFGRYTLDDSLYLAGDAKDTWFHDHTEGITTGQTWSTKLNVSGNTQGLRIVLTWTDYPGAVGANPALINNLNLLVTAPDGTTNYRGNCWGSPFANADSRTTCGSYDVLNTAEGMILSAGSASIQTGEWTFQVIGQNVPVGPQPFALAVITDLDRNYGVVSLDKMEYSDTDSLGIRVVDVNGPAGSLTVDVTSDSEPTAETATLNETGDGIYEGTLALGFGPVLPDSMLQVSDGDLITASYADTSPLHTSIATARVEAIYPKITNVRATDISNSVATIRWSTDIPANSTVYYGKTPALGSVAQADSGAERRVTHGVVLSNLTTDTIYYFDVASTDRAGHTTRDSRGGAHYTFRTSLKGEILLVIGDSSFTPDRLNMYRAALTARKWSTNEWDIATQGMPTLALLRDYKAVLWQVGLEQYPPFETPAMDLINGAGGDDYLDGGGRILFTGHDIAWALCDTANSQWASAASCAWVRATLKANYQNDPSTPATLTGLSGDPISGSYLGGICYARHRDGGAMDEITEEFAADTFYVWRSPTPDDTAVRWLSPLANGTGLPGSWTWKNLRSKVVSFFFEYTGINWNGGPSACTDSPGNRADILNKTIVWLIGDGTNSRDHPWVAVSSPNGGETITADSHLVTWSKTVAGGLAIANQALYYSPNAGQNWVLDAGTIPGIDTSFTWDVTTKPNGKDYLVRIVATDNGAPPMNGSDESDAVFTINRPGGDLLPPLVHPGSVRMSPHPATTGQTATITATVDDSTTGNSDVHPTQPAEYQFNGLGWVPMTLASGPTSPTEGVTWTGTTSTLIPAGWNTLCVRGRDAPGNLGTEECTPVFFLQGGPAPPGAPMDVHAQLSPPLGQAVEITWTLSASEGTGEFDHYEIHRGTAYDSTAATYTVLPAATNLPAGTAAFTDATAVAGTTYFYAVKAVGIGGDSNGDYQVAKYVDAVGAGQQLLSLPLILQDTSVSNVFGTLSYASVRYHDVADVADPWKAAYPARTGDFTAVDYRTAFWANVSAPGEWRVAGRVPTTTQVNLVAGWNFVSYASFIDRNASTAFASLPITRIEAYDAAAGPYFLREFAMAETMSAGNGYWVYASAAGTWTITN